MAAMVNRRTGRTMASRIKLTWGSSGSTSSIGDFELVIDEAEGCVVGMVEEAGMF